MARKLIPVCITLPPRLREMADAEATRRNTSRSKLIAIALMDYLEIPHEDRIDIYLDEK